jgi:hypothetical protein
MRCLPAEVRGTVWQSGDVAAVMFPERGVDGREAPWQFPWAADCARSLRRDHRS